MKFRLKAERVITIYSNYLSILDTELIKANFNPQMTAKLVFHAITLKS